MSLAFNTEDRDVPVPADEKTLIAAFGLSPMEARFLQGMLNSVWVGKEELPEVSFSIRQVIYMLRKKLEMDRVWIINNGRGRYSITPDGKRALSAKLKRYSSELRSE
jgi:hypothetical protein